MRRRLTVRRGLVPAVHRHALPQIAVNGCLVALAYFLAYLLRFENGLNWPYSSLFEATVLPVVASGLVIFVVSGLYERGWRFFGQRDYEVLLRAVVLAVLAWVGYIALAHPYIAREAYGHTAHRELFHAVVVNAPASVIALDFLLCLLLLGGARFAVRAVHERRFRGLRAQGADAHSVLIVGAGEGGRLVFREIKRNPELALRPIGFLDDDPRKRRVRIEGMRVLGDTDSDLPRVLDEAAPDEVVIAIPSAPGTMRGRIVAACRPRGIPVRTLPTVFELLRSGANAVRQIRPVEVEDVLGREPVVMELERVGRYLKDETVLVTGAGGSIGSELARQIAHVGPRRLILLDHAEDNLFDISRELEEERHVRTSVAVLADCKEEERMREVFAELRPSVVFHAAAYKHVGLMESNPIEAFRNNALATRLVGRVAGDAGVRRFVLVSTDKAVAPATVMGASKALAEWAVEAADLRYPSTRFTTVRFGNVLGSSGSVVPIFRRQIAAGGPVTITDPRMTRYFMTIQESVQLVIRSGSLAEGGEVFVLDMGEPVPVIELAKDMIRLSGLEPYREIDIQEIGRRPGEKLHEELFNPYERPQPTPVGKIQRADRPRLDPEWLARTFDRVNLLVLEGDAAGLAAAVTELAHARAAEAGAVSDATDDAGGAAGEQAPAQAGEVSTGLGGAAAGTGA